MDGGRIPAEGRRETRSVKGPVQMVNGAACPAIRYDVNQGNPYARMYQNVADPHRKIVKAAETAPFQDGPVASQRCGQGAGSGVSFDAGL